MMKLIHKLAMQSMLIAITVALLAMSYVNPIIRQERAIAKLNWQPVTVKPGDTLWMLAAGHPNIDRQALVDEIMRRNGCSAMLYIGQRLEVPAREGSK